MYDYELGIEGVIVRTSSCQEAKKSDGKRLSAPQVVRDMRTHYQLSESFWLLIEHYIM